MKKIFTLAIAALFFSLTSFAADRPRDSKISVSANGAAFVQIKIDGKKYDLGRNTLMLDNIKPGYHKIEVYKTEQQGFFKMMKRSRVIYSSSLFIEPAQLVSIDINRMGSVNVQKSSFGRFDRDNDHDRDYGKNDRDNHYGRH